MLATDSFGCTQAAQTQVSSPSGLVVDLPPSVQLTCATPVAFLDATVAGTGQYSYTWTNAAGQVVSAAPTVSVSAGGIFSVQVTDIQTQCAVSGQVVILDPPALAAALPDTLRLPCGGGALSLGAAVLGQQPWGHDWQVDFGGGYANAGQDSALVVDAAAAYRYIVTDAGGCADTATVAVIEAQPFVLALPGTVGLHCSADTALLSASVLGGSGSYTYRWTDAGGGVVGTAAQLFVAQTGTYELAVSDAVEGCADSTQVTVTPWNQGMAPQRSIGGSPFPQVGDTVTYTLLADPPAAQITWTTGPGSTVELVGPTDQQSARLWAVYGANNSLVVSVQHTGCDTMFTTSYPLDVQLPRLPDEWISNQVYQQAPFAPGTPGDTGRSFAPQVQPNPTGGEIVLRWPVDPAPGLTVTLYDLRGQRLFQRALRDRRERFDLSRYPAGLYYLHVDGGSHPFTARVVRR